MVKGMLRIASGWWMLVGATPAGRIVMVLGRSSEAGLSADEPDLVEMALTKNEALGLAQELRAAAEGLG